MDISCWVNGFPGNNSPPTRWTQQLRRLLPWEEFLSLLRLSSDQCLLKANLTILSCDMQTSRRKYLACYMQGRFAKVLATACLLYEHNVVLTSCSSPLCSGQVFVVTFDSVVLQYQWDADVLMLYSMRLYIQHAGLPTGHVEDRVWPWPWPNHTHVVIQWVLLIMFWHKCITLSFKPGYLPEV